VAQGAEHSSSSSSSCGLAAAGSGELAFGAPQQGAAASTMLRRSPSRRRDTDWLAEEHWAKWRVPRTPSGSKFVAAQLNSSDTSQHSAIFSPPAEPRLAGLGGPSPANAALRPLSASSSYSPPQQRRRQRLRRPRKSPMLRRKVDRLGGGSHSPYVAAASVSRWQGTVLGRAGSHTSRSVSPTRGKPSRQSSRAVEGVSDVGGGGGTRVARLPAGTLDAALAGRGGRGGLLQLAASAAARERRQPETAMQQWGGEEDGSGGESVGGDAGHRHRTSSAMLWRGRKLGLPKERQLPPIDVAALGMGHVVQALHRHREDRHFVGVAFDALDVLISGAVAPSATAPSEGDELEAAGRQVLLAMRRHSDEGLVLRGHRLLARMTALTQQHPHSDGGAVATAAQTAQGERAAIDADSFAVLSQFTASEVTKREHEAMVRQVVQRLRRVCVVKAWDTWALWALQRRRAQQMFARWRSERLVGAWSQVRGAFWSVGRGVLVSWAGRFGQLGGAPRAEQRKHPMPSAARPRLLSR
jgi:hypothetical protein